MKTLFVLTLSLLCTATSFSQTKEKSDSLTTKTSPKENLYMRCTTSISEEKLPLVIVDGFVVDYEHLKKITPEDIESIELVKEESPIFCDGSGKNGVLLVTTKSTSNVLCEEVIERETAFNIHKICNTNWVQKQDVYNAIQANVAGVSIRNSGLNNTPNINIRGNTNTIVIVDGVRTDASILNSLNPADIDHIKVAKGPAASHYLRNN